MMRNGDTVEIRKIMNGWLVIINDTTTFYRRLVDVLAEVARPWADSGYAPVVSVHQSNGTLCREINLDRFI